MNEISAEEWREWATNKVTKAFLDIKKEDILDYYKNQNKLDGENVSNNWSAFKQYKGRILECYDIIDWIEEMKESDR